MIQDRQRLQTSTLATHSNDHPDVPTPQSIRWRLQLPVRQLGLQHNIPRRWEPGLLGNIQQPWTVVQPKGNSQFLLSPLERRHQPRPGLREFRPGQPTAGQRAYFLRLNNVFHVIVGRTMCHAGTKSARPHFSLQQKKQVTTPQIRRLTGICPGAPSLQHLHLWPASYRLQKVRICWRPSNHACWCRLAGSGRGAD